MATPLNTSALLQVDSDYTSETFNAGFTFTAGNDATAQFVNYSPGGGIASVTIGGTTATARVSANADADTYVYLFDAFNITGGTANVVVTYAGSGGQPHYISGGVQEWDSADGLAYDTGTANSATGNSTTPSVSTAASTSQNNTVVISAVTGGTLGDTNVNLTNPSGWAGLWAEQNANIHVPGTASYHEETTTGTKTATSSVDSSPWAALIAAYTVTSSGTQALTPSLVTNTQTFYAPTVGRGAVALSPSLVTNAQTFYSATVSASYALTPALYTNEQVFYGPTVSVGAVSLLPSLVTNEQVFYSPTVSGEAGLQELFPGLVTNTQTFYGATLTPEYGLTPELFTNAQVFYAPAVASQVDLQPELFVNASIFYAATVAAGVVELQPTLVTNEQTFYAPTVLLQSNVELFPELFTNEQVFFSPTVAQVEGQAANFGGWWPAHPYSRKQVKTREERDRERQDLGILPTIVKGEAPAPQPTARTYQRAAEKLLQQLPKVPIRVLAPTYNLPAPSVEPTMAPDVSALVVDPDLLAAQRKRVFEQDLVYIVATLIS